MLGVDVRVGVDLKGVVVDGRVLEQAVERIEHFVREKEEELPIEANQRRDESASSNRLDHLSSLSNDSKSNSPRQSSVIQPILSLKLDHQPLLQIVRRLPHDLRVRPFEDALPRDLDVALSRDGTKRWLGSEVDELPSEVSLVLRNVLVEGGGQSRIVPSGGLEEKRGGRDRTRQDLAIRFASKEEKWRERKTNLGVVIDEVDSSGTGKSHLPSRR